MTTKITPSVLENTAVVAATHGNGATIPVIVVDPQGRITGVTNTSVDIATSQITSGTLDNARLPNSGVAVDSYGSASRVPRIIVDAKGRVTSLANIDIQIATSQITGYPTFAASATSDTTNASNIGSGTLPDDRLSNAGVNTGTFGSATVVPRITVDAKGRVTSVTATSIAIAAGSVSGLATSATTDTTNASNIGSGTLPDDRLSNAGVNTGLFGTASVVPRINVDAKGRVTSVTATSIAIAAGSVSGLATVATSGSYLDLNNRPSVPAAQVNSDWNAASGVAQILNKPSLFDGNYNSLNNKPTIPTNTNQLTNGAGFITSAVTSIGEVGAIMGLYNKSLVPQGTITFYRMGQEVAGSNLFYVSGDGYQLSANPGTRYSFNNRTGVAFEEVIFSAYWNSPFSSPLAPWVQGLPAGRSVVTVSGTWRAIRPNMYAVYIAEQTEAGFSYESFCNIGLWQRIA